MMWTDNPIADAERYYAEQEEKVKRSPKCTECGEHIQDEYFYEIDGVYICCECMKDNHKKWTEDYIDRERADIFGE